MSARGVPADRCRFPVRWFEKFAVAESPADKRFLTAPGLAGERCAGLEAGAAALVVELPGAGLCDSACLDALMRAARRAQGWGSWLRLDVRDQGSRKMVRLRSLGGGQ